MKVAFHIFAHIFTSKTETPNASASIGDMAENTRLEEELSNKLSKKKTNISQRYGVLFLSKSSNRSNSSIVSGLSNIESLSL